MHCVIASVRKYVSILGHYSAVEPLLDFIIGVNPGTIVCYCSSNSLHNFCGVMG